MNDMILTGKCNAEVVNSTYLEDQQKFIWNLTILDGEHVGKEVVKWSNFSTPAAKNVFLSDIEKAGIAPADYGQVLNGNIEVVGSQFNITLAEKNGRQVVYFNHGISKPPVIQEVKSSTPREAVTVDDYEFNDEQSQSEKIDLILRFVREIHECVVAQ